MSEVDLCCVCGRPETARCHYWWPADGDYHKFKSELEKTPIGFLRARVSEVEREGRRLEKINYVVSPFIKAVRDMLDMYEKWPVYVETPPTYDDTVGYDSITIRITHQMEWLTRQEYLSRFGSDPPMAPAVKKMLEYYQTHPNFQKEWLE